MTPTRVFFRIKTPEFFPDIEKKTLEEAEREIQHIADLQVGRGAEYWRQHAAKCAIFKITEQEEQIEL